MTRTPFTLVPVAPLGTTVVLRPWDLAIIGERVDYPPSPRGRQLERLQALLGLTDARAASALGLKPDQVSQLQIGRATLESEADWHRAEQALREAAGCGTDVMR